jgi:hypothetical protein
MKRYGEYTDTQILAFELRSIRDVLFAMVRRAFCRS